MKLAKVIFDIPIEREFFYLCEDNLKKFTRVLVPLGNKKRKGFVIDFEEEIKKDIEYKWIKKVYDESSLINYEIYQLSEILSKKYYCSKGQVIFSIIGNFPFKYDFKFKIRNEELFQNQLSFKKEIYLFDNEKEKFNFYLELIEKTKGSLIIMFPEVSMVEKFFSLIRERTNRKVFKYYGEMDRYERFNIFLSSLNEKNLIIIGTRVSIFLPLFDLSLIVIDSYMDSSYKEKKYPKFNSIEVAETRSILRNIPLLLTSYAFSVNDYYEIKKNKVILIDRRDFNKLPEILIINKKRDEMDKKVEFLTEFSSSLIEETILKGKKVGIVHNRKGTWKTFKCENCGHVLRCKNCNSILVLTEENKLFCKYCRVSEDMIKKCIKCGSKKIVERIIGIEKIYKILKEVYADFKIKKFTAEEREIDKEIDIFVGTTIIKEILNEFDFGAIIFPHADSFLNFPYYNSEEIFFIILNEFLWKLKKDSRLILQTKNLNLEIFNSLKTKNFNEFYEKELKIRKLLDYPPFSDIIVIEIPVKKSKFFENRVNILKQIIENSGAQILSFDIIDNKKGKQSLKIIFKAGKDKRPDFQKMMGMKEKLDFRIEINPEII